MKIKFTTTVDPTGEVHLTCNYDFFNEKERPKIESLKNDLQNTCHFVRDIIEEYHGYILSMPTILMWMIGKKINKTVEKYPEYSYSIANIITKYLSKTNSIDRSTKSFADELIPTTIFPKSLNMETAVRNPDLGRLVLKELRRLSTYSSDKKLKTEKLDKLYNWVIVKNGCECTVMDVKNYAIDLVGDN